MKKIEDLIVDKIYEFANCALSMVIKPDIKIQQVKELDDEIVKKIKEEYGIEGIILDVDETLRRRMRDIPKCNQEWIDRLKEEFKVIIVSNGKDRNVELYFKERGIDYIGFACKPLKTSFKKACEKMELQPEEVLVVGNSLFSDIYGGKKNRMKTALVSEVAER